MPPQEPIRATGQAKADARRAYFEPLCSVSYALPQAFQIVAEKIVRIAPDVMAASANSSGGRLRCSHCHARTMFTRGPLLYAQSVARPLYVHFLELPNRFASSCSARLISETLALNRPIGRLKGAAKERQLVIVNLPL